MKIQNYKFRAALAQQKWKQLHQDDTTVLVAEKDNEFDEYDEIIKNLKELTVQTSKKMYN